MGDNFPAICASVIRSTTQAKDAKRFSLWSFPEHSYTWFGKHISTTYPSLIMHTLASCWDNFARLLSWSLVESPAYNEIGCSTIVQHKLSKPPTCWLVGPHHIRQFFALLCLYVLNFKRLLWFYDIVLVPRDNCLKLVGISASTSTDLSANCAADDDPALLLLGDVVWPHECCNHPRTVMNSHRTTVGM